ncbi:MAG: HEAT repeat domain-containing protein [Nibricoccus sp.]
MKTRKRPFLLPTHPAALSFVLLVASGLFAQAKKSDSETILSRCTQLISERSASSPSNQNVDDAIIVLGLLGDARAVPALADKYRKESNDYLRFQIVRSLGWIGHPSALPLLEEANKDPYRYVPKQAAIARSKIKGEAPIPRYARGPAFKPGDSSTDALFEKCAQILKFGPLSSTDKPTKTDAILGFGFLGDERAIPLLTEYLENEDNQQVRLHIVRALGWIRGDAAVAALEYALNDPYLLVRKYAATNLEKITGKKRDYDRTGEAESKVRLEELRLLNKVSELDLEK